ncbi:MAG: hypothetical protein H7268_09930 [Sandarakinorhabdus sp.]|nr:hypothetical protein [Sandarakinorhabdus sp.]
MRSAYLAGLVGFGLQPSLDGNFNAVAGLAASEAVSAVPEPLVWAQMPLGFGIAGGATRRSRSNIVTA